MYRRPELLLAACQRVLHALVQHLFALQILCDLSQFVCRLCQLLSFNTWVSTPQDPFASSLALRPTITPMCSSGVINTARGPYLEDRGSKCSSSPDHSLHAEADPIFRASLLPGPALQEARLLCRMALSFCWPRGRSLSCEVDLEIRELEADGFLHFGLYMPPPAPQAHCSLKAPKSLCFSKLS